MNNDSKKKKVKGQPEPACDLGGLVWFLYHAYTDLDSMPHHISLPVQPIGHSAKLSFDIDNQ
jgi:hypothetical protein